jgi:hypothetical protein
VTMKAAPGLQPLIDGAGEEEIQRQLRLAG